MNPRTAALGFDPGQAAGHAAFALAAAPLSAHTVMFPLWRVVVRAAVTEAQPYQLIDRYLVRGVGEAGLTGSADLASFLSLDPALVRQALAFLRAVGHVEGEDGSLALTALGRRSLEDRKLYTVELDDRRILRFDGFSSEPLSGAYYHRTGAGLTGEGQQRGAAIPLLFPERFREAAVAELAGLSDRERYNLPLAIKIRDIVGYEVEYLPACVVHVARGPEGARHLVCTRPLRGEHDPRLGAALETSDSALSALMAANEDARSNFDEESGRWLSGKGLSGFRPRRVNGGSPRVGLAADAFRTAGEKGLPPMGSLVVLPSGGLFQLWCEDVQARRRELVRRVEARLDTARSPAAVRTRLGLLVARLEPGPLDDDALCGLAVAEGSRALGDRLRRILSGT
ncbi:hypothetical protein [Streptomyces sp. NPDC126514]|uniref:hypothetical protein n=1 Tax=Streptomyces sp. NPDC126514 TaxID=3155210 RepID=UPI003318D122